MARVNFVKKARKAYPEHGIKQGESYYWWKFRNSGKFYSKTLPKPSQLTQSDFMSQFLALEEQVSALSPDDSLPDAVNDIVAELQSLGEEQRDKLSNMPEGLQQGDTGQLLEERAEACDNVAQELEGIDMDIEEPEEGDEDAKAEAIDEQWQDKLELVQGVSFEAP